MSLPIASSGILSILSTTRVSLSSSSTRVLGTTGSSGSCLAQVDLRLGCARVVVEGYVELPGQEAAGPELATQSCAPRQGVARGRPAPRQGAATMSRRFCSSGDTAAGPRASAFAFAYVKRRSGKYVITTRERTLAFAASELETDARHLARRQSEQGHRRSHGEPSQRLLEIEDIAPGDGVRGLHRGGRGRCRA